MVWILVGYMWLFIHRPFEIWPIFATIRIERTYMIFAIIAWFAVSVKSWTNNRNNLAIFTLAFSIFISTLVSSYSGFGNNLTTENWFKMFVFFLLVMTSVKSEKDLKILVTGFLVCYMLYMLHSVKEYQSGRGVYRMGTWRMIGIDQTMNDPNTFGNGINYAMTLLLPLYILVKNTADKKHKRIGYLFLLGSIFTSIYCILMTGSRSSLMGLIVSVLGLTMLSKYRFRIIMLLVVAAPLIWINLPEDRQMRYMTIIDPSVGPENAQASAEGRLEGFYGGLRVWQNNFLFGVGPGCYAAASGGEFQTHNLIGQVTSELGALGTFAFLLLMGAMISNYFTARSIYTSMKYMGRGDEVEYFYWVNFAIAWTVLLLFGLGFAGHNAFRYTWLWYAAFQAISTSLMQQKLMSATYSSLLQRKY